MILRLIASLVMHYYRPVFSINEMNIHQNVCGQKFHIFLRAMPLYISICFLYSKVKKTC